MASPRALHLLDRISALLRSELRRTAAADGLEPVHVLALDYLARANRFSNHPLAVAEYLGLSKGNMSQRLNVLERMGLIRKNADKQDGRRVHLELTRRGAALLARHYPPKTWPAGEDRLEAGLERLLRRMVADNRGRTFGECRTCRFHLNQNGPYCGLLQLALTEAQAGQICREHEGA
jgi:DNA-binding MarR family transcriptional regulator